MLTVLLLLPPPPDDVLPAWTRERPVLVGVHAPNRRFSERDFRLVQKARVQSVKMMSYHSLEEYQRLRSLSPAAQFVVRLETPWHVLPDSTSFAVRLAPRLRALVDAGFEPWVEVGNEPNLELSAYAEMAFAGWYGEVVTRLRSLLAGLPIRIGFPGLAPDQREWEWLEANRHNIEASDWLGAHAYWRSERDMVNPAGALRFTEYRRRFPNLRLVLTEAGSQGERVPSSVRAQQYRRFARVVNRFAYVDSLHFFILSGTDDWRGFFLDDTIAAALAELAAAAPTAGESVYARLATVLTGRSLVATGS